jgi:hypothetical protein
VRSNDVTAKWQLRCSIANHGGFASPDAPAGGFRIRQPVPSTRFPPDLSGQRSTMEATAQHPGHGELQSFTSTRLKKWLSGCVPQKRPVRKRMVDYVKFHLHGSSVAAHPAITGEP